MSRLSLLYIIGVPGAGKTTVVRRIAPPGSGTQHQVPYVYYTEYTPGVIQLGWDRETFGGTDSLGMAAQKHVIAFLEEHRPRYVLAEGDRLANMKFFAAVQEMGYDLDVCCLEVSEDVLQARRAKRNAVIGKAQNENWLKTRMTKVANLKSGLDVTVIDANRPAKEVAKELSQSYRVIREIRRAISETP